MSPLVVYLCTDVGLPRRQLVALPFGLEGWRGESGALAARDDADLEWVDADDAGRLLLLVWNVAGRSELDLFDTVTGVGRSAARAARAVASAPCSAATGAVLLERRGAAPTPRALAPEHPDAAVDPGRRRCRRAPHELVEPELIRFPGQTAWTLTGWLYRAPGRSGPGPAMLSLHGGPEAQERPVFDPQHQALVAAGITVFAPNIRGSSGFGRDFVHADDVHGRRERSTTCSPLRTTWSAGGRRSGAIAVTGRSYGGYLTLAALAFSPGFFAAGIDICGMSDLLTFYRDTEPWIAAAAVTKYGDPVADAGLLEDISPLHRAEKIDVPLLVVHGELDTNVPIGEAHQIVAALRELGRPVTTWSWPARVTSTGGPTRARC